MRYNSIQTDSFLVSCLGLFRFCRRMSGHLNHKSTGTIIFTPMFRPMLNTPVLPVAVFLSAYFSLLR